MHSQQSAARYWIVIIFFALLAFSVTSRPVTAQGPVWSQPFRLSSDGGSWFPDIAVDPTGRVHVIWSSTALDYRSWNSGAWTQSNDIAVAVDAKNNLVSDPFRGAIATDRNGKLHLFYYHLTEGLGYYTNAPVDKAGLPSAWSPHQVMGARGTGYYSMLAIDSKNRLHAVYINQPDNARLADIFYRRSEDGGATWTFPVNLSNTPQVGSSRPQIIIDHNDVIHISWDEGWDRRSGEGVAQTSRYVSSTDGGKTWSNPSVFGTTKLPSAQLVVGSSMDNQSRIAVWRAAPTIPDDNVYFQSSSDGGKTWSAPNPIPGITARPWNSPLFDQYAMAQDKNGIMHLVLVGRPSPVASKWIVEQVEWNGVEWNHPEVIFDRDGSYPEYPRVAFALGNQMHVVWFTRPDPFGQAPLDIWHSYKTFGTLDKPFTSFPTPTLPPPTPTIAETRSTLTPVPKPVFSTAETPTATSAGTMLPAFAGVGAAVIGFVLALVVHRRRMRVGRD